MKQISSGCRRMAAIGMGKERNSSLLQKTAIILLLSVMLSMLSFSAAFSQSHKGSGNSSTGKLVKTNCVSKVKPGNLSKQIAKAKSPDGYPTCMFLFMSEAENSGMTQAFIEHNALPSAKAKDGTGSVYFTRVKVNTKPAGIFTKCFVQ